MEDHYKVFSEQYNGILDLVEKVDEVLVKDYKRLIDNTPKVVLEKIISGQEFLCDGKDFRGILEVYEDELCFELIKYGKYLSRSVNIKPFYEDELEDDEDKEDELFLFSLTVINIEDEPTTVFNYVEKNGSYEFVSGKADGLELDTEVFIEKREGKFFLTSRRTLNDIEVYKKEVEVDYKQLISAIAYDENLYDDDNVEN